jgi:type VI secretion system protein ImpK
MNHTATMTNNLPADGLSAVPRLRDLLEDGFYLLFLLRDGNAPISCADFNKKIDRFFAHYDKQANNFGKPLELVEHTRYAFCALLDEIVLESKFPLRNEWTRMPLQLRLYSEHLAGEGFFERLRELRAEPVRNIEALEVFHTCLLLGFQGRFLLEGQEKRDYLTRQLGQDIQRIRNEKTDFAPNWKLPHRFQEFVRNEMPMWFSYALLALVATVFFVAYRVLLGNQVSLILGG